MGCEHVVMSPRLTVIVPVAVTESLSVLIRSIDAQSLPYGDFGVTYVVVESSTIRPRLEALATRRPNVTVAVAADAEGLAAGVQEARARVETRWVLVLPTIEAPLLLPPRALESLVAAGERHDAGAVAGRTYTVRGPQYGCSFRHDGIAADGLNLAAADTRLCLMEATSGEGPTAVVASYPCLAVLQPVDAATDSSPRPAIDSVTGTWSAGALAFEVSGSLPADFRATEVTVEICQPSSGQQFWLPTSGEVSPNGTFAAAAGLDPATAAAGEWLDRGLWEIWLSAVDDRQRSIRARLDAPSPGGAVLGGRLLACKRIAPGRVGGKEPAGRVGGKDSAGRVGGKDSAGRVGGKDSAGLVLDVDATRHSLFRRFRVDDAQLEETVQGTRLRLSATELHVDQPTRVPGRVLQDGFSLPAVLIADPAGSAIECWLSGLQGNRGLSTAFDAAPPAATGLRLRIAHTGQMSVLKQPKKKRPAPAAGPSSSRSATAQIDTRHWAARLRRRMPAFLEPAVGRVARLEIARAGYRRLTRRLTRRR